LPWQFWMLLTHTDDGHVTTASYRELLLRLCKVLNPDLSAAEAQAICEADLKRTSHGHGTLTYTQVGSHLLLFTHTRIRISFNQPLTRWYLFRLVRCDFAQVHSALFEIADTWTDTIDAQAYVVFLDTIFRRCALRHTTQPSGAVTVQWPATHIVYVGPCACA
jgi:hypothetical protein